MSIDYHIQMIRRICYQSGKFLSISVNRITYISFLQQIIEVTIFVHSCRICTVRRISNTHTHTHCLTVSSSTYTTNRKDWNQWGNNLSLAFLDVYDWFPQFLSPSLSFLYLINRRRHWLFFASSLSLFGYKSRCLPIQSSFPLSDSLILARIELFH